MPNLSPNSSPLLLLPPPKFLPSGRFNPLPPPSSYPMTSSKPPPPLSGTNLLLLPLSDTPKPKHKGSGKVHHSDACPPLTPYQKEEQKVTNNSKSADLDGNNQCLLLFIHTSIQPSSEPYNRKSALLTPPLGKMLAYPHSNT